MVKQWCPEEGIKRKDGTLNWSISLIWCECVTEFLNFSYERRLLFDNLVICITICSLHWFAIVLTVDTWKEHVGMRKKKKKVSPASAVINTKYGINIFLIKDCMYNWKYTDFHISTYFSRKRNPEHISGIRLMENTFR